jgi:hypothetical protein
MHQNNSVSPPTGISHPKCMNTGINAKTNGTTIENAIPVFLIMPMYFLLLNPNV